MIHFGRPAAQGAAIEEDHALPTLGNDAQRKTQASTPAIPGQPPTLKAAKTAMLTISLSLAESGTI